MFLDQVRAASLENIFQVAAGFVSFKIEKSHRYDVKESQEAQEYQHIFNCHTRSDKKSAKEHENEQNHKRRGEIIGAHRDVNAGRVQVVMDFADDNRQEVIAVMNDAGKGKFTISHRPLKEFVIARQPPAEFARLNMRRQLLFRFICLQICFDGEPGVRNK